MKTKQEVLSEVKQKLAQAIAGSKAAEAGHRTAINWAAVIQEVLALVQEFWPSVATKSKTAVKASTTVGPADVQADLDALNSLETTLTTDTAALNNANAALATAQGAQATAQGAVNADDANIGTALAKLVADAQTVYGAPPAPAPTPTPMTSKKP